MMDQQSPYETTTLRHEPIETDVRSVWRTGAALAGVVIGSFCLVVGLMKWFAETRSAIPAAHVGQTAQRWNLPVQLKQLRSQEEQLLEEFEWIDRANGLARIPIERAKQIVADDGLPTALSTPATAMSTPRQGAESVNSIPPAENNQP